MTTSIVPPKQPGIDSEIEANEDRVNKKRDSEKIPSIADMVEDAVTNVAKPLAKDRPTAEDLQARRIENDAEQH